MRRTLSTSSNRKKNVSDVQVQDVRPAKTVAELVARGITPSVLPSILDSRLVRRREREVREGKLR